MEKLPLSRKPPSLGDAPGDGGFMVKKPTYFWLKKGRNLVVLWLKAKTKGEKGENAPKNGVCLQNHEVGP